MFKHMTVGKKIILGLRPEYITSAAGGTIASTNTLELKVNVIEDLGHERLVYFSFGMWMRRHRFSRPD